MVKKAATVTAWGVQEKKGDRSRLTVTVNVTNSGAGHTIPTGLPGVREMWLEVEVLGPQGEILGQRRFRYGQRLVKRDGSEALPWEAFKTLEENRIQPRQSKQNSFDVLLPATLTLRGDVKIRARLFMRLISEASSRRLNIPAPDPILAASAEATVAII